MNDTLCITKNSARITPYYISGELHTIPSVSPYTISLDEKPSSIVISGYTEVDYIPFSSGNFYVDYDRSIVYFYSGDAGNSVSVDYYGGGSIIKADDVNRFSDFLDRLKSIFYSFRVESLSGSRVRINGGCFVSGDTIYNIKEMFIDFGPNGNFEVSISSGYFKKILIGIDVLSSSVSIAEGTEAPKYDAAVTPSYSSDFKPVAILTIGSDFNIEQSDIIKIRNFLC